MTYAIEITLASHDGSSITFGIDCLACANGLDEDVSTIIQDPPRRSTSPDRCSDWRFRKLKFSENLPRREKSWRRRVSEGVLGLCDHQVFVDLAANNQHTVTLTDFPYLTQVDGPDNHVALNF